jgi:antitoxin (DNA-binding transcriptional repressor) of toxin-antitoxin stability system
MRFISVRDLRAKSAEVWRDLPKEREMVVTSNGRPIAIIASVGETDLEDMLSSFRTQRAINALARMQLASMEKGLDKLTLDDINAIIQKARDERER